MKQSLACRLLALSLLNLFAMRAFSATETELCSTEKVNKDCVLLIERKYPIAGPTIQMRPGATVTVQLSHPMPFETLSLDFQGAQAVSGTDQLQALISGILPSLKAVSTAHYLQPIPKTPPTCEPNEAGQVVQSSCSEAVENDLAKLADQLDNPFPLIKSFIAHSLILDAQLKEITSPIPRPGRGNGEGIVRSKLVTEAFTPDPWGTGYYKWRRLILCELVESECPTPAGSIPTPAFKGLLSDAAALQQKLAPPPSPANAEPGEGSLTFDDLEFKRNVASTRKDIARLSTEKQDKPNATLDEIEKRKLIVEREVQLYAETWPTAISAVQKDLQTYFANIRETPSSDEASTLADPEILGQIYDPRSRIQSASGPKTASLFARQVVFSINAVNQVAILLTSVPTSTQKTAIATVTVLYADPIFEVSTGALFSSLPNRTFSNQTQVSTDSSGNPTTGNIVIKRANIVPVVIPFVAGNVRLFHDFTPWHYRRSAVYFTGAVGFNAYNTTAEYASGLSFSWRSVMISPLAHFGHDVHLTQGEFEGQTWCSTAPASTNPTNPCVGTPPAPSTKTYWTESFAIGISIRVPSVFSASGTSGH